MKKRKRMTQPDWLRFWRLANIGIVLITLLVPYRTLAVVDEINGSPPGQVTLSYLAELIACLSVLGRDVLRATSLLSLLLPLALVVLFSLCLILACRYFVLNLLIALSSRPGGQQHWLSWRVAGLVALAVLFPFWTTLPLIPAWLYAPAQVSVTFLPGWFCIQAAFLSWLGVELVGLSQKRPRQYAITSTARQP